MKKSIEMCWIRNSPPLNYSIRGFKILLLCKLTLRLTQALIKIHKKVKIKLKEKLLLFLNLT